MRSLRGSLYLFEVNSLMLQFCPAGSNKNKIVFLYQNVCLSVKQSNKAKHPHTCKHQKRCKTNAHIIVGITFWIPKHFYAKSYEAQDRSNPEKHGKSTKQLSAELDPFRRSFGRSELIQAISQQYLGSFFISETLGRIITCSYGDVSRILAVVPVRPWEY